MVPTAWEHFWLIFIHQPLNSCWQLIFHEIFRLRQTETELKQADRECGLCWGDSFPFCLSFLLNFCRLRDRLISLVVKASASRAEDPEFESRLRRDFSEVESNQWHKIATLVDTLPGAWRYRVSTGTGWPSVRILWLGEMESWICNFYLSVAACKIVRADPSLRYTRMLLGR